METPNRVWLLEELGCAHETCVRAVSDSYKERNDLTDRFDVAAVGSRVTAFATVFGAAITTINTCRPLPKVSAPRLATACCAAVTTVLGISHIAIRAWGDPINLSSRLVSLKIKGEQYNRVAESIQLFLKTPTMDDSKIFVGYRYLYDTRKLVEKWGL